MSFVPIAGQTARRTAAPLETYSSFGPELSRCGSRSAAIPLLLRPLRAPHLAARFRLMMAKSLRLGSCDSTPFTRQKGSEPVTDRLLAGQTQQCF